MKQGAFVNLLIGITIALLPFYNRVAALDFQRTAKDNLAIILFSLFGFLLPGSVRKMSKAKYFSMIYGLFLLVINQWNVLSINVMFQSFYVCSGVLFFCHFYEKHDKESIHYILNGMIAGALIQSFLAIPQFFGVDLYRDALLYFSGGKYILQANIGSGTTIGTLGNINLLSSYLALCSLAFLKSKKILPLVIIPVTAMILNGSLMGICSLIAGAGYFLNLKLNLVKKWQIYSLAILAMITYPFSGIGHDSGRIEIWANILKRVDLKHFLFGMGPGWFPDQRLMQNAQTFIVQEHNEFISFFNFYGIAGLVVIAPIFFKFINQKVENKIFSSILFVAFCNSYGHFSLHQSTVAIIIIVTAAICMAEGNKNGINLDR